MGSMRSASGSDRMKLRGNSLFQDAIFVVGAGYSLVQASLQSLLFAADGIVVIYLTFPHEEGDPVTPTLQQAGARV